MKIKLIFTLSAMLLLNVVMAQQKAESTPLVQSQIQVAPIKDTQNNRQYELYIELPEGYAENPDKKYPVLYYTDAVWHMEVLSAGAEYILTEAILVGISWQKDPNPDLLEKHGPQVSRYWDYSITESDNPEVQEKYQLGQAGNHLVFIRKDVIPYMEGNYRTDPENRSYFGYSMSGLFGAYVLLSQPDTFRNYILGSPSLKGDVEELRRLSSKIPVGEAINAHVFVSYGEDEKEASTHIDQFIDLLKSRKDPQLSVTHQVLEGNHQTAFPLTGIQSVKWLADLVQQ